MRYLSLDIGSKRVGVAVGSREVRIATPLTVFERARLADDAERLRRLAQEYEVDAIVVGLPRNQDGSPSEQEALTRAYVEQLKELLPLPFLFQDERHSTSAALLEQRARGVSQKRGRATLDASAAAVILQDFLDSQP